MDWGTSFSYPGCLSGSVVSSVVSGFSVGFSAAASSLEELSDKVETEPDSSSEMTVWVWSEELPVTCVLSESVVVGRETFAFSSQESVREPEPKNIRPL